jgi:lipopolysaccharide/colanic/teichoic acid biosynthesis glycosyltransferase
MDKFLALSNPTKIVSTPHEAFKKQTHLGFLNQTRNGYIKARPLLEFLIAFIGLIFSLPVFFIIGILIKTTSRGEIRNAINVLG